MPQNWQEWIALGLVAFTVGILLGRWLNSRRRQANGNKTAACGDCPSSKPKKQAFKNIPINLQNNSSQSKSSDSE